MELCDITPLILTYNEEANLRDTLRRLAWAQRIVVVDSFSDDSTLQIAEQFPRVDVFQRPFDHFAEQCNAGLSLVRTPWTLSLDADYKCPPELAIELQQLDGGCDGYQAGFQYCIYGRPLRASLYPPRVVLYQTAKARYERDGHAHRVSLPGEIGLLRTPLLHDDRKPLAGWVTSQAKYAAAEAAKLAATPGSNLALPDRLRKWLVVAPPLTLLYCLFFRGLVLDGRPGLFYTFQRVFAELLLSLVLLEHKLNVTRGPEPLSSDERNNKEERSS